MFGNVHCKWKYIDLTESIVFLTDRGQVYQELLRMEFVVIVLIFTREEKRREENRERERGEVM